MRPAHIHIKASSGKSPILTTQLYFKGDPWIHHDAGVRPSLIMSPRRDSEGLVAKFDFVIKGGCTLENSHEPNSTAPPAHRSAPAPLVAAPTVRRNASGGTHQRHQ